MDFVPKSDQDTKQMLEEIGADKIQNLYSDIPVAITLKQDLNLKKGLSEFELKKEISDLANKNKTYKHSFLGAGAYNHYIPSVVYHITSRSEFYTAYTPYQAEMSQGILQAIFEYQTMICNLTDMDVTNASVYDGAEALAEAAVISINKTRKKHVIISKTVHPEYRETVRTYLEARDVRLIEVDYDKEGKTDISKLKEKIDQDTAGIIIQSPNFFGVIENTTEIKKVSKENNPATLLTCAISDPTCLGIIQPPDYDIITAEGQSFGNPRSFGGPYLGIIAVKKELMRNMPGRIIGQTKDSEGKIGYILTLQAREQHIRREKASSNICSNQALNALAATAYLAALGKKGLNVVAKTNLLNSHYFADKLKLLNIRQRFDSQFYNEFIIQFEDKEKLTDFKNKLKENNIEPGLELKKIYPEMNNCMLICITEKVTKKDIDKIITKIQT